MATVSEKEPVDSEDLPPELIKGAEAGDAEKQRIVGSHFLKVAEVSDEEGKAKDGNTATLWLVRSSKQGDAEATSLLKKCMETGIGITDDNRDEVKWCVQTSSMEKRIRNAARGMFSVMNTAHKEVLSKDEYILAVKKMAGGDKIEEKLLLAAGKKLGDEISETEFAKILSKKIQGNITLTAEELSDRSDGYETASLWEKIVKYPKETTSAVADHALEYTSKEGLSWLMKCIPTNQIYLFCIFFLYSFVTPRLVFTIIPLIVFYISFGVMVVTTLQMFYKKKKRNDSSRLAGILKQYDVGVDVDQTQSQYTWNSLTPYLIYFGALPITILSFSLADKSYIPCAEVSALCLIFAGICFTALSDSHDLITLMALGFPLLLTQTKKLAGGKFDLKYKKAKIIVMVIFSLLAIIPLIFVRLPSMEPTVEYSLTLKDYSDVCQPRHGNTVSYQMKCSHLVGQPVSWAGVFKHAKVAKVENKVASLLDGLPGFIANPLRCIYGEYFPECNNETMGEKELKACNMMESLGCECHVKKHDSLSFQIGIEVRPDDGDPINMNLDAGNGFRYKILALEEGDEVQFDAFLVDGLGTTVPQLKLKKIECTSRELMMMHIIVEDEKNSIFTLSQKQLLFHSTFSGFHSWNSMLEKVYQ
ncbi:hypothetical protein ScPMuIL_015900 [Solemya velum]